MSEVKRKLKIPRDKWLRGEDSDNSYLLRDHDEKMCCLGIYLQELGVSEDLLRDIQDPTSGIITGLAEAAWLIDPESIFHRSIFHRPSSLACKLMNVNDQVENITEQVREERIAAYFLEAGVEVEFV